MASQESDAHTERCVLADVPVGFAHGASPAGALFTPSLRTGAFSITGVSGLCSNSGTAGGSGTCKLKGKRSACR